MLTGTLIALTLVAAGHSSPPAVGMSAPSHLPVVAATPRPAVDVTLPASSDNPRRTHTAPPAAIERAAFESSPAESSAATEPSSAKSPVPRGIDGRSLLADHWGHQPDSFAAESNRTSGIALAGLVIFLAAGGLLWCWKRLGGGWTTAGTSSPLLMLRASLPLRPGVSLHLLSTTDSDLLVAVDQRGLQSVTLLRGPFDLAANLAEEDFDTIESPTAPRPPRSVPWTSAIGDAPSPRLAER